MENTEGTQKEKIEAAVKEVKQEVEEKERKQTDEEILFEEMEVAGFEVKPWTVGKLLKVNPCLEKILTKLAEQRIVLSMDNISDVIPQLYFTAFPEVLKIVGISVDKAEEDLHDLDISDLVKLIFIIFRQNQESIKNVFSLLQTMKVTVPAA